MRLRPELGVGRFGLKDGVGTVVPLAMSPAALAMSRTAGARVVPGDGSDAVGASTLLSLLANLELPSRAGRTWWAGSVRRASTPSPPRVTAT
ncbi:MAG: hypothetical protein IPN16_16375 [Gemmatimonadetes bacterium]|nr:hypothetical protein [Gemmatimonadota bacterium]